MVRRLFGLATFVGVALASTAACTLLVDNSFKGYGDQCTLPNANATKCGQCVQKNCGQQITDNCNDTSNQIVSSLNECAGDPSPPNGDFSESRCYRFVDDASAYEMKQATSQFNLRTCVASHCGDDCTRCTDLDAGPSACGQCILTSCKAWLDGRTGCCGTAQDWVAQCTDVNNPACLDLKSNLANDDAGYEDSGYGSCNMHNFAVCVRDNCIAPGTCK